jgi:hypothetical protein
MMDVNSRYDAYSKGRNGGWLTLNQILRREGQNPLPPEIGDARLAPSTMKVLGSHGEPVNATDVQKAMDLLSAMTPIHPDDAEALLKAMVPGLADDALKALIRRLPDYKPAQSGNTPPMPGRSRRKKDANGQEHDSDGKFGKGGGSSKGKSKEKTKASDKAKEAVNGMAKAMPDSVGELHKQAEKKADSWIGLAGKVAKKSLAKARDKITGYYKAAEKRYGKSMARAIIAVGIVGIPVPVPGASFALAAPLIAAAELYHRLTRSEDEPLDREEVLTAAKEFWEELLGAIDDQEDDDEAGDD